MGISAVDDLLGASLVGGGVLLSPSTLLSTFGGGLTVGPSASSATQCPSTILPASCVSDLLDASVDHPPSATSASTVALQQEADGSTSLVLDCVPGDSGSMPEDVIDALLAPVVSVGAITTRQQDAPPASRTRASAPTLVRKRSGVAAQSAVGAAFSKHTGRARVAGASAKRPASGPSGPSRTLKKGGAASAPPRLTADQASLGLDALFAEPPSVPPPALDVVGEVSPSEAPVVMASSSLSTPSCEPLLVQSFEEDSDLPLLVVPSDDVPGAPADYALSDIPLQPAPLLAGTDIVDLRACLRQATATVTSGYRVQVEVTSASLCSRTATPTFVSTVGSVDDGCMELVMATEFYAQHRTVLGDLRSTSLLAQVADSRYRPFDGELDLVVSVAGVDVQLRALVMSGPFNILLGRTWLHATGAVHLYAVDWLYLQQHHTGHFVPVAHSEHPGRGPLMDPFVALQALQDHPLEDRAAVAVRCLLPLAPSSDWAEVGHLEPWASAGDASWEPPTSDVPARPTRSSAVANLSVTALPLERQKRRDEWQPHHPFRPPACTPERAGRVLSLVTIGNTKGDNLSDSQRQRVCDLVSEFQHVFGLEPADLASNRLIEFDIDVDPDVKPYRCARVPPMTDDDREWLVEYCTKLLDVGILRRVDPHDVTWCSEVKIVPKGKGSYTNVDMETLRDLANLGLKDAGLPFDPDRSLPTGEGSSWVPPSGRRLVHNYVQLNKATRNVASFPTRTMEQKVKQLAGHSVFSTLDMMSGYFAILASLRAQKCLTFFVDGLGYLTYTRMPFGPTEGPTRYNLFGSRAFGHLEAAPSHAIGGHFVRWFDDINIASKDFEDHLRLLRTVLEVCEDTGGVLSTSKTILFGDSVKWCGNIINQSGVASDPDKVATIVLWKTPRSAMDVVRFVNTANFFRGSIPEMATISAPLTDLTAIAEVPNGAGRRKGSRRRALKATGPTWKWGLREEKAFRLVKAAVAFAISSGVADFSRPWHVHCDASPFAIAGALLQEDSSGRLRVLHVVSKKCAEEERPHRMTQFLRELVAMRFALDKFEQYVKSGPIVVTTDCIALRDLLNASDLKSTHLRWRESLMGWPIVKFVHRPGKQNLLCDGLSRRDHDGEDADPVQESWIERQGWAAGADASPCPVGLKTTAPHAVNEPESHLAADTLVRYKSFNSGFSPEALVSVQQVSIGGDAQQLLDRFANDPLQPILWFLLTGDLDGSLSLTAWVKRMAKYFYVKDGSFHRVARNGSTALVVTVEAGVAMAVEYHEKEGHYGRDLVVAHFSASGVYWWNMRVSVRDALLACDTCQRWGPQHIAELMGPIIHPQPFDLVAADFLKLPSGRPGSGYILVIADYFSRFTWAFDVPDTGEGVVQGLSALCAIASVPKRLLTDNGSHFANKTVAEYCELVGIRHSFTPVYSPWVNGLVERQNGLIIQQLRKLCQKAMCSDWPAFLRVAIQHINRRVLPDLGYRPIELLFGIIDWGRVDVPSAIDSAVLLDTDVVPPDAQVVQLHQTLIDHLRDDVVAQRLENVKARDDPPVFSVGQLVMLRVAKRKDKLAPHWEGPFVVGVLHAASAELLTVAGDPVPRRHHISHLKAYHVPTSLETAFEDPLDPDQVYIPEPSV